MPDEVRYIPILKAKKAEVEGSTALTESVKKSALTYLNQAIHFREQADKINKEAETFTQTIQRASERIKEIETELKGPTPPSVSAEALEVQNLDSEKLEQKLRQTEAALVDLKANLTKLNDQIAKEENLPQGLRKSISDAREGLKAV